jgi:predicted TIM-barrel fold metal-dependent hydrolase
VTKLRNWLKLRKKTEAELPYEPPFWFGDYSNGELYHEATPRERRMRALILEKGAEQAKRHGMERREFMASGLGVTLSLSMMNLVNGCTGGTSGGFNIDRESEDDPLNQRAGGGDGGMPRDPDPEQCEQALKYTDTFIFDIQTHRVESATGVYRAFLSFLPQGACGKGVPGCYSKDEYTRELFLDSDTTMTVMSGIPAVDGANPLTNEQIAETRDYINGLASDSERVITHAMVLPNYKHEQQLEGMERIVKSHAPVGAWKCYTPWGPGNGVTGFWLDDPKIGIPFIEKGREIGVKTFCCHKGLPLPGFDNRYGDPKDIGVVAKAYPDTNFVVYHSGYQFGSGDELTPYTPGNKIGVNSLVTAVLNNNIPPGSNVYGELGTTWFSVMNDARRATHVLGKLLKYLGEDNIVWGTDSMWYGSPQPQIIAFMSFRMDQRIREAHGYPDLTPAIKRKILGLNAAKVYGVDPTAKRCGIARGAIAQQKERLDEEFGRYRWALQQPRLRTRRDFVTNTLLSRAQNRPG